MRPLTPRARGRGSSRARDEPDLTVPPRRCAAKDDGRCRDSVASRRSRTSAGCCHACRAAQRVWPRHGAHAGCGIAHIIGALVNAASGSARAIVSQEPNSLAIAQPTGILPGSANRTRHTSRFPAAARQSRSPTAKPAAQLDRPNDRRHAHPRRRIRDCAAAGLRTLSPPITYR